jgi:hypothetical protein
VTGMARQGYDLQLTRYDEKGSRATFYTTGMEHSPTSATRTACERTPSGACAVGAPQAQSNRATPRTAPGSRPPLRLRPPRPRRLDRDLAALLGGQFLRPSFAAKTRKLGRRTGQVSRA